MEQLRKDVMEMLDEINVKRRKERLEKQRKKDIEQAMQRIKASVPQEPRVYVMN